MFSAVAALRRAGGATVVGPLVIGRYCSRPLGHQAMLSWLKERVWVEARCCRCDGEQQNGSLF